MSSLLAIDPAIFARAALVFYVAGLLVRDGLWLRVLLLFGTVFYILYYFTVGDTPLWDAIFASLMIGAANLVTLIRILVERTTLGMTAERKALFAHFPTMTPGQFRKVMRAGQVRTVDQPEQLVSQGAVPLSLYYVLEGPVFLKRNEQRIKIQSNVFIGEISFIQGKASEATATVDLGQGARFIEWDRERLYKILERSQPLSNALTALFNRDMSYKLTQSFPSSGTA